MSKMKMTPSSEAELADCIAGLDMPVRVEGGGTRGIGGEGEHLSVAGLSGVELYEPGALTLVVRAGTPVAEVDRLLAAEGQRLAFEPMDHRALMGSQGAPTIGGVMSGNISGPRRMQAGAARDFLLGVRFVDGRGEVIRNGGRVMKNVTGYDLVKLMAGAHGTLGVLSEVSLKVLPQPEMAGSLLWHGLDWAAALEVFCNALGSPFDVTGAARLPGSDGGKSVTLVRVEGFEASVRYRLERLRDLMGTAPDAVVTDPAEHAALWQQVRDVEPFAGQAGTVWKTSVRPTDMIRVTGLPYAHVVDWGGGLIWTLTPDDVDLRAELAGVPGHVTCVRGGGAWPRFHPQPEPLARIEAGLRAKFDPRGIFNPGLMSG